MTNTNAFIASKPMQAGMTVPLVREPRPAQFALGGSALEWQGYRALCARMQQAATERGNDARCSTMGPDAAGP
jgi:hypothetical protein